MEITTEDNLNIKLKEVENQLSLATQKLDEEKSKFKDILTKFKESDGCSSNCTSHSTIKEIIILYHSILQYKSQRFTLFEKQIDIINKKYNQPKS